MRVYSRKALGRLSCKSRLRRAASNAMALRSKRFLLNTQRWTNNCRFAKFLSHRKCLLHSHCWWNGSAKAMERYNSRNQSVSHLWNSLRFYKGIFWSKSLKTRSVKQPWFSSTTLLLGPVLTSNSKYNLISCLMHEDTLLFHSLRLIAIRKFWLIAWMARASCLPLALRRWISQLRTETGQVKPPHPPHLQLLLVDTNLRTRVHIY